MSKSTSKRLVVTFPDDRTFERLERLAKDNNIPYAAMIRLLINSAYNDKYPDDQEGI